MKLNKYYESSFCYILVVPTTQKVFSRRNLSDNYVQVPSSMHSNVQLLYLPLFFAVVVGVAVLVALGPYYWLNKFYYWLHCCLWLFYVEHITIYLLTVALGHSILMALSSDVTLGQISTSGP